MVGPYLDPPERALVLCVDEKLQIQALDRSQPVLSMMPGVPERATHDYLRAGTTTLFAALNTATGEVIGSLHRHRAAEFKKFLTKLDKEIPADLDQVVRVLQALLATWTGAYPTCRRGSRHIAHSTGPPPGSRSSSRTVKPKCS